MVPTGTEETICRLVREWFTTVGPDDGTTYTTRETDTGYGKHIEIIPGDEDGNPS